MVQAFSPMTVASGATPTTPMPFSRAAMMVDDVGAVALEILHGRLVGAVAVGDFRRVGGRRRAEDEGARQADIDGAGEIRMGEVDAAIDHADLHAEAGRLFMRCKRVDDRHVPLARGKLIRPRHARIASWSQSVAAVAPSTCACGRRNTSGRTAQRPPEQSNVRSKSS